MTEWLYSNTRVQVWCRELEQYLLEPQGLPYRCYDLPVGSVLVSTPELLCRSGAQLLLFLFLLLTQQLVLETFIIRSHNIVFSDWLT